MAYKNLKAEMARFGISQKDLSTTTGKSSRQVWNWLNSDEAMMDVCDAISIHDKHFPEFSYGYLFSTEPLPADFCLAEA